MAQTHFAGGFVFLSKRTGVVEPQIGWMTKPDSLEDSLGLEYLTDLSELIIRQEVKLIESLSSQEIENTYRICNSAGEQVYYAQEESKATQRQCCGSYRQFTMHIRDKLGMEIIRLKKKFVCCGGSSCFACCKGCSNYIEIEAPVAIQIGYMRQERTNPQYVIYDTSKYSSTHSRSA
ncbi:phospholipid scramblase 2-like [Liolophura sinensis]|uniref:phospholipid scramblase 2-like n=1 Tax=Liolophura sinensis TaxID=3198878 RepID=UPI0031588784